MELSPVPIGIGPVPGGGACNRELRRIPLPRTSVNKGRSCSPVQPQIPLRVQFIVDSSVVGYDGGRNVKEEHRVDQQQSPWQPTRRQLLWAGASGGLLTIAILIGYRYGITLWDWIKLLVVPAVIAGGGFWFNRQQQERQRADNQQQQERELALAERRSQDEALQAYLDGLSQLLTDKDRPLHRAQVGDGLSTVARARTLTVLPRLDGERKRSVVQFLYESGLIARNRVVVYLGGADLRGADLRGADLRGAHLTEANLFSAILEGTDLIWANLRWAILIWANLSRANLSNAILEGADLRGANLFRADLSNANVSNADVSNAKLSGANLIGADLRWADLSGAQGWTEEQLTIAEVLEGATMPNGQKYEDWLKDKQAQGRDEGNE